MVNTLNQCSINVTANVESSNSLLFANSIAALTKSRPLCDRSATEIIAKRAESLRAVLVVETESELENSAGG